MASTNQGNSRDTGDPVVTAALNTLSPDHDGRGIVDPLDELALRRKTDTIVGRFRAEQATRGGSRRFPRWSAAAALLACAGVGWWVLPLGGSAPAMTSSPVVPSSPPPPFSPTNAENRRPIPGSRFALLAGDVVSGAAAAAMGDAIPSAEQIKTREGRTAIALPTGIAMGLADHTSVRVLWDGGTRYRAALQEGMVLFSVDPRQARDGFFVDTPAGTIRVTGTAFTVMVSPEDGVFVELHRGEVEVERPGMPTETLSSGDMVELVADRTGNPAVRQRVQDQLQAFRCMDEGVIFTELSHFSCRGDVEDDDVPSGPSNQRRAAARPPTIRDLMDAARAKKAGGDWSGAARSYGTLIRQYPKSNEAKTSMVSLAQIQLRHLGDPEAALRLFSRYLEKGAGPLAREAMFGQAAAYRALNDPRRETRILERFLEAFSDGPDAKAAERRLRELRR